MIRCSSFNIAVLMVIITVISQTNAFLPAPLLDRPSTQLRSLICRQINGGCHDEIDALQSSSRSVPAMEGKSNDGNRFFTTGFSTTIAALAVAFSVAIPANAVSGGGLDYANIDITGQNFSNGNYKRKDFTQVIAKGTNFANSNLQGCRFYKAYLVNVDFGGADLRGAALEDTSMDGANLKDANVAGAYFGPSILDTKSLENVDFTDAQLPTKVIRLVCARADVKGTHPVTGADTRESLMCP